MARSSFFVFVRASSLFALVAAAVAALSVVACGGSATTESGSGGTADGGSAGSSPSGSATGSPSGGSSSGSASPPASSSGATCASTVTALCERAASCAQGACRFAIENDAGAVTGSMAWATLDECKNFWLYTCGVPGGVRADFDYDACTDAIAATACVSSPQGDALVYPPVCNVNAQ